MKYFTINVQSTIDIITNSSSELFLLDERCSKTIETIESMLREMLRHWNEMALAGIFGDHYVKNERYDFENEKIKEKEAIKTYEDTFGKIFVFTREMYEAERKTYEKYKQDGDDENEWGYGYERPENIGRIVITSHSDNSIPYEMFEWIESAFGGERFHLG